MLTQLPMKPKVKTFAKISDQNILHLFLDRFLRLLPNAGSLLSIRFSNRRWTSSKFYHPPEISEKLTFTLPSPPEVKTCSWKLTMAVISLRCLSASAAVLSKTPGILRLLFSVLFGSRVYYSQMSYYVTIAIQSD